MAFRHPVTGKVARWVVLPQGTRQSPAIFCKLTNAVADLFNSELRKLNNPTKVHVFVDDFIYDTPESFEHLQQAYEITNKISEVLGLSWNKNKDIGFSSPTRELEALGLTINTDTLTMSLPEDKRLAYLSELRSLKHELTTKGKVARKLAEKLLGKLVFASRVNRWGFLFLQSFMDCMYPPLCQPPSTLTASDGLLDDLRSWEHFLSEPSLWPGIQQHMVITRKVTITKQEFNLEMFSDASKTFGIGGCLVRKCSPSSGTRIGPKTI